MLPAPTLKTTSLPLVRFASLSRHAGLMHGVSTRHGGVSVGPYASLNLGAVVGDDRANVETNHRLLAQALGVTRADFTTVWQVHSNRVVRARETDRGTMIAQADGIVTDVPELPLIQRFGDCTPLLLYDPQRQAIGLAHAGWRGTVNDMASALVAAMISEFGSDPADLVAVIGPSIGPCCYEVGPEVVAAVRAAMPAAPHVLVSPSPAATGATPLTERQMPGKGDSRFHLDLWQANRWQLAQAGVTQIEVAGVCTKCHRDTYFSHRGDQGRTGRFAAVMMLRR